MTRSRDFYIYNDLIEAAAYFDDVYQVKDKALLVLEYSAVKCYRLNEALRKLLNDDFKDFPPIRSKLESVSRSLAAELTALGTYLTKLQLIDDLTTSDAFFGKIDYLQKMSENVCYANPKQLANVITITLPSGEEQSTHVSAIISDLAIVEGFVQELASIVFKTDTDSLISSFEHQYPDLDILENDVAFTSLIDLLKITYKKINQ